MKVIQVKLLESQNVIGETFEMLVDHMRSILEKYRLTDKIIAFCVGSCNTSYNGIERNGKNNVFHKVSKNMKVNILVVGCAAHIVHNALQTSADMLPVDVESIINKVFQHFHY
jgi:hypothetical protein